jgi:hypothetical protein
MRVARLLLLGLGASAVAVLAGGVPASADPYDYPWCAQGPSYGYPGECMYQNLEQCQASVSGQYLACGQNPRFLFGEKPQPQPAPRRRGRHVHHHH